MDWNEIHYQNLHCLDLKILRCNANRDGSGEELNGIVIFDFLLFIYYLCYITNLGNYI